MTALPIFDAMMKRHTDGQTKYYSKDIWFARDVNQYPCYDWQRKTLDPFMVTYKSRDAAKGFARLCMKIALRRLGELFPEADLAAIRESFKAAFTKEPANMSLGSCLGCYFMGQHWNNTTIAHEVAHWADSHAHRLRGWAEPFEGHGPKWRGWFVHILSEACPKLDPRLSSSTKDIMVRGLDQRDLDFVLPS